jgi:hypothetical protein
MSNIQTRMMGLIFMLIAGNAAAQMPRDSELFLTMQRHDSTFFERAFNSCDTNFLKQAIHADLVFYHDRGGIQNKTQFLTNAIKNLCSDWNNKPIRKVRKESLEVYPLYNEGKLYGVVQSGVHDFYIRKPGTSDTLTGTAKFTHVYLLEKDKWILKEVLSFDHK